MSNCLFLRFDFPKLAKSVFSAGQCAPAKLDMVANFLISRFGEKNIADKKTRH